MNDLETVAAVEVFVLLVAAAAVVSVLTRRLTLLPYSVALVLLGLVVSAIQPPLRLQIGPDLLLAVLIPGLIFEAAYRLDLRELIPTLPAVTMLATVGVLVTALVVALALMPVTDLPFAVAFIVGTTLAATDPAAVVSVVRHLHAPSRLVTLVEAESLFNDGTGLVIFVVAIEALGRDIPPLELAVGLLVTVVLSIVIGAVVGGIAARLLAGVNDHLIELTISLVAAYGSYLLAERLGQSGILATVVCGILFARYGRQAASARAEDAIDTVWEFIGFLMTTLVFLLVGLAISLPQLTAAALPAVAALAGLLVSRAIVVYLILGAGSLVVQRLGWAPAMTRDWLHVIAWAGLRGAIAIALALSLPPDLPDRELAQGIVFGCVLLTLLIQGTTADALVHRLGLATRSD